MPKISVIVPVYNTEKYLKTCLNSLINQTFPDVEIICINDGSTDGSAEILKKYPQIKVITQKNKGLSEARNAGIEIAAGEYISFVDSDDWVDLDFFKKLYKSITKNNADIACATIKRRKNKYRVKYEEEKVYTDLEDKIRVCGLPESSYVWNKLYKREVVINNIFPPVYYEDMLWTPNVIKEANKIVTVPETTYYYRPNSSSIVKKCPSKKKQEDFYNAKKYLVHFFDENKIKLSEKERYITRNKYYFLGILWLKIKEYRYNTEYYLFGFIPTIKITQYPKLVRVL